MNPSSFLIASGPVIIEHEKVLLNKEQKDLRVTPWFFPGGRVENFTESLEDACRREVKEELGIDIDIIRPLKPILQTDQGVVMVLIHFLAKRRGEIKPGKGIVEWAWHDIRALPADCAPNVYAVINEYLVQL